nr:MAG TPA: hypothetical protein [Caudoviricetes sp.]
MVSQHILGLFVQLSGYTEERQAIHLSRRNEAQGSQAYSLMDYAFTSKCSMLCILAIRMNMELIVFLLPFIVKYRSSSEGQKRL